MTIEGAPFPFFGGKQGLARQIASLLPPHEVYCEPYAGSCAVLWRKPPSPLEVINDMDGELVHFYKVLRDPWLAAALQFSLTLTPHARKEWRESVAAVRAMRAEAREGREARVAVAGGTAAATQAQASGRIYAPDVTPVANLAACSMMAGDVPRVDTDQDPPVEAPLVAEVDLADLANMANAPMTVEGAAAVERARRWYVAVTQSFSKTSTGAAGWAFCRQPNGHVARKWRNWVEELPPFTLRLARVQIEEMDAIELISHYDAPNVVFYIDPSYLPLTRTDPARHGYAHEMSCEDHVRLLEVVTRLRGHALLSGYHSPLYDEALAGWRCVEFATYASSATPQRSKRPRRTECLWLSPGAMVQPSLF